MHGGVKKDALGTPDVAALERGLVNLEAHVAERAEVRRAGGRGAQPVHSPTTDEEIDAVLDAAQGWGARAALCDVWAKGGEGGRGGGARRCWPCSAEGKADVQAALRRGAADQAEDRDHRDARSTAPTASTISPTAEQGHRAVRGDGAGRRRRSAWPRPSTPSATTRPSSGARRASASPSAMSMPSAGAGLRGGAGRRDHDHAGPQQDAVGRGDPGPSRRHDRGTVLRLSAVVSGW